MARIEVCKAFCGKMMINESSTPVYVGRGIIRLYPDDSSTPVVLGRGDIRLEPDERSTPSDFGHGDTRLPPYEGTQWQGMKYVEFL